MIQSMFAPLGAAILIAGIAAPSAAAPCREAKGRFIKCDPAAPAPGTRCKDAKGKFAKCGTPEAAPAKK